MDLVRKVVIVVLLLFLRINESVVHGDNLKFYTSILLDTMRLTSMDAVLFWNLVALQAGGNDYDTSVTLIPDQPGPTFSSRAYAIIHGAIYEAANVFYNFSKPVFQVTNLPTTLNVPIETAAIAAVTESSYQTLINLYPKQKTMFDVLRQAYFNRSQTTNQRQNATGIGITVGQMIAFAILNSRTNDGSKANVSYTPNLKPGYHQVDPTHPKQSYVTPQWGQCKPFVLTSVKSFRSPNIIGIAPYYRLEFLNSSRYLKDYEEVKSIGSKTSSIRTKDQTEIGNFWAYDGAPKLGTPTRLFNQVVRLIAIRKQNTLQQNAHLFGLVNYALADSAIATWETKYYYNFWRPIVAIREGTTLTPADPNWLPLGAPADGNGDNFTPGFPSYISGHASSASAVFQILRHFYNSDQISFKFKSDEYDGKTIDSITNSIRPSKTRRYQSLTQAENEVFLSRIYLGVHWRIDQEYGQTLGRSVGTFIYNELK